MEHTPFSFGHVTLYWVGEECQLTQKGGFSMHPWGVAHIIVYHCHDKLHNCCNLKKKFSSIDPIWGFTFTLHFIWNWTHRLNVNALIQTGRGKWLKQGGASALLSLLHEHYESMLSLVPWSHNIGSWEKHENLLTFEGQRIYKELFTVTLKYSEMLHLCYFLTMSCQIVTKYVQISLNPWHHLEKK